jgi:hypothetical protein
MKYLIVLAPLCAALASTAQASSVSGSFSILDFGSGASYTSSLVSFANDNVVNTSNPATVGDFGTIPNLTAMTLVPSVSLVGIGTSNTGANLATSTPVSINDLFSVSNFQFNLTSLQYCDGACAGGPFVLYGFGNIVDHSGTYTPSTAQFTLSFSGPNNYSASFYAPRTAPVPLPASAWLMLSSVAGLGALAHRRKSTPT